MDDSCVVKLALLRVGLDDVSQPNHVTGACLGSGTSLGQGFSGAQFWVRQADEFRVTQAP